VTAEAIGLAFAVAAVALLYSALGQAGASGYIAVMSLAGLAPAEIRPTALLLNVLVGAIASVQFWRSGHFSWPLFWPFALLAVPLAFVGGALVLPARAFALLVGTLLCLSALRLVLRPRREAPTRPPPLPLALLLGAGIGLLAGLTGTGGGIFLTPLLLLGRFADTQRAAGVTAVFVLVNSLAGLTGNFGATRTLPALALPLAAAAALGGLAGSRLGSRRLSPLWIERLLAAVLCYAGARLVLGA
jgi:hypothetical protein